MKRTIMSMLGAVSITGLVMLNPVAVSAQAANPPTPSAGLGCVLVNDLSSWPRNGHYYYCGSSPSTFKNSSASSVSTLPAKVKQKLIDNDTWLIITDTVAEANTYLGTSVPAAGVLGNTARVSWGGPVFTFISSWETVGSTNMDKVLVHEQGHALDFAFGKPNFPSGVTSNPNAAFWQSINMDWVHINGLSRAVVFPHGVPNQRVDKPGGTWTAYNEGPAEGTPGAKTNQQILQDLFPWLFGSTPTAAIAKSELWAHLYTQYRNKFIANDCPYTDAAHVGTETLNWSEVFTHFVNTAETNSVSYFGIMWTNTDNFVP